MSDRGSLNVLAIDTATPVLRLALAYRPTRPPRGTSESAAGSRPEAGGHPERIVWSYEQGLHHARHLMPLIQRMLGEAGIAAGELDCVVAAGGPGSFTGLRIGLATAKGLRAGTGAALVTVPTLDAMAYPYSFYPGLVVPVLDARKRRFYAAAYSEGSALTGALDISAEELSNRIAELQASPTGAGAGAGAGAGPGAGTGVTGAQGLTSMPVLLVGRDAHKLLDTVGERLTRAAPGLAPESGTATAEALLELGMREYRAGRTDPEDAGPIYVRDSDAELHRSRGGTRSGGDTRSGSGTHSGSDTRSGGATR